MDLTDRFRRDPISHRGVSALIIGDSAEAAASVATQVCSLLADLGKAHEVILAMTTQDALVSGHELLTKLPRSRLLSQTPLDYGQALSEGLREARYPLVWQLETSESYDLADIKGLLSLIDSADIVCGSRDKPIRSLTLRPLLALLRLVFALPVRDWLCPFRLYRRTAVRRIVLQSSSRFANAELLAKATFMELLVAETPISWQADYVEYDLATMFADVKTVFVNPVFCET